MITKKCKICGVDKPLDCFSVQKTGKHGVHSYCKVCFKEKYYKPQPITEELRLKKKKYMKRVRLGNPMADRVRDWKRAGINITADEYLMLYNSQDGRCGACGRHESEFENKLVVDHCHDSGKIRGLLCRNCNMGIGFMKDNAEYLEGAANYIREHNKKVK